MVNDDMSPGWPMVFVMSLHHHSPQGASSMLWILQTWLSARQAGIEPTKLSRPFWPSRTQRMFSPRHVICFSFCTNIKVLHGKKVGHSEQTWNFNQQKQEYQFISQKLASASWSPSWCSKVLRGGLGLESPIAWNFIVKPRPPAGWFASSWAMAQSPPGTPLACRHWQHIRQHPHPQHHCVFMQSSLPSKLSSLTPGPQVVLFGYDFVVC